MSNCLFTSHSDAYISIFVMTDDRQMDRTDCFTPCKAAFKGTEKGNHHHHPPPQPPQEKNPEHSPVLW
jgi:hypothetical protein